MYFAADKLFDNISEEMWSVLERALSSVLKSSVQTQCAVSQYVLPCKLCPHCYSRYICIHELYS